MGHPVSRTTEWEEMEILISKGQGIFIQPDPPVLLMADIFFLQADKIVMTIVFLGILLVTDW